MMPHVFVYGTLRRHGRNDIARYRPSPVFVGEARIAGTLYDLGAYPGIVLGGAGRVKGEIYRVDPAVEAALDLLEEVAEDDSGEYIKRRVRVAVGARGGGGVDVRVADRGPGVPPEHRERIFEKFHRVDDALTAEKTGAGLGLSIARQLARGLGGELRYVARSGAGAEFVLELPA